jgi:F-type H+-transporting ATPase subunit delta
MAETTTLARPYAKAAFEYAHAKQALPAWSDRLRRLGMLVEDPAMRGLLDSPAVAVEEKTQALLDLSGEEVDEAYGNFVSLLAKNGRLPLVPEIIAVYELLKADAEKTIEAEVISARELTDKQQRKLAAALQKRLGREVALKVQLDDTLVGGAVIRAGDLVIDGSAEGRLRQLAKALGQ